VSREQSALFDSRRWTENHQRALELIYTTHSIGWRHHVVVRDVRRQTASPA